MIGSMDYITDSRLETYFRLYIGQNGSNPQGWTRPRLGYWIFYHHSKYGFSSRGCDPKRLSSGKKVQISIIVPRAAMLVYSLYYHLSGKPERPLGRQTSTQRRVPINFTSASNESLIQSRMVRPTKISVIWAYAEGLIKMPGSVLDLALGGRKACL